MSEFKLKVLVAALAVCALVIAGCGSSSSNSGLSGEITLDGSSTVYPFAQASAELFREEAPDVRVTVGESGTGGGFEKFCRGETQISNASRPIKPEEEELCKKNGVKFTEFEVALDGIAVVTNPDFKVQCLTVDELKKVWNTGSKVTSLSEVNPELPSTKLSLFGPGTDSGTFDYFTEAINGEEGASRTDYQPSEDDNVIVEGVAGDKGGLGYFGFSYFEQNQDTLNLVAIDNGDGCVSPSTETIQNGTYAPLSRALSMYVSDEALAQETTKSFVSFMLDNHAELAEAALMVPMSDEQAAEAKSAVGA